MSLLGRSAMVLVAAVAIAAALLWRVDQQVELSAAAIERQPSESIVHARRLVSVAFGWQQPIETSRAILVAATRGEASVYAQRSRAHAKLARRSYAQPWKVIGLLGFALFVGATIGAIASSGKRNRLYVLAGGVGFTVFAMGMVLL